MELEWHSEELRCKTDGYGEAGKFIRGGVKCSQLHFRKIATAAMQTINRSAGRSRTRR